MEIRKRLGRLAWKSVDTVVNLTEQQHMKSDPKYGDAVQHLRTRECTLADVDLFNSRVVRSAMNPSGVDMSKASNYNASVIVTTNKLREVLNREKVYTGVGNVSEVITCFALDSCSHRSLSLAEYQTLLNYNVTSISQSLSGSVLLFEGMPVILCTRNLSTDLGITNGSQGFGQKIFTSMCPVGLNHSTCMLVKFPHSKVEIPGLPRTYFPITPVTWPFTTLLNKEDGSKEKIRVSRSQLPIQPAYAITGHSAQGKTLPKVLVDLSNGGFAAYVAASRAKSREGLCLIQPVMLDQLNKPLPADLLAEVW